jgi:hypothetical protein
VLQHFGPVLTDAPHLLAEEAVTRFDIPAPVAISRNHRYYYKRVVDHLRKLKLGSKTGIACHGRANWKGDGSVGAWAIALVNTVEALRTQSPVSDHIIQAFVRVIEKDHPRIAQTASTLPEFGSGSVDEWIRKGCSPILYILLPSLRPAKRGKKKITDIERADPRAKRERDAIVQRIRSMAAAQDKSRSFKSRN